MQLIRRHPSLDNFFVEDDLDITVENNYNFYIDTLLYYQRLFEYSGNVLDLLLLPYNLFQDLIMRQLEMKKKQMEKEKQEREKVVHKSWKEDYKPLKADFM